MVSGATSCVSDPARNSEPRLLAKSNPSRRDPCIALRRRVFRRSGCHWFERKAAPYALPSRHVDSVSPPPGSLRVSMVPRSGAGALSPLVRGANSLEDPCVCG